jgi:hypothetical protein
VERADVIDGNPEALLQVVRKRLEGALDLFQRDLNLTWPDTVESLCVLQESYVTPIAYVLDDAAGGIPDLLGEKAAWAAQFADYLAWVHSPRV